MADGREALESVRRQTPDLVISEVLMPQMDGFTLCRSLRRQPALAAIPFVFYSSAFADADVDWLAHALGADRFLVKPTGPDRLTADLRDVLAKADARRASASGTELRSGVASVHADDDASIASGSGTRGDVPLSRPASARGPVASARAASHEPIAEMLAGIGRHFDVDAILLLACDDSTAISAVRAGWLREVGEWEPEACSAEDLPWLSARCLAGEIVDVARRAELPAEAIAESAFLAHFGIEALLVLPFTAERTEHFALLVGSMDGRPWTRAAKEGFGIVGRLLGAAAVNTEARQMLRVSEQRYRSLVEDMPDAVVRTLPDGTLIYANRQVEDVTGLSVRDVIGRKTFDFLQSPDDVAKLREDIATLTPERPTASGEYGVVDTAGDRRWVLASFRGLFDERGRPKEVQIVGRDVTDSRQITLDLMEKLRFERFLNETLEMSSGMVPVSIDQLDDLLGRLAGCFGVDRVHLVVRNDELLAEPIDRLWVRDGPAPRPTLTIDQILPRGIVDGIDKTISICSPREVASRSDVGAQQLRLLGVEAIACTLIQREDSLEAALAIGSRQERVWTPTELEHLRAFAHLLAGIVQRDAAERARVLGETLLRAVIQTQPERIVRWRRDGEIIFVNDALADAMRMEAGSLIGRKIWELIDETTAEQVRASCARLSTTHPIDEIHGEFISRSSGPRFMEWTNHAVFDHDGSLVEIQSIGRDRTDAALRARAIQRQLRFQTTVSWLSSELVVKPAEQFEQSIGSWLSRIAEDWNLPQVNVWTGGLDRWRMYRLRGVSPIDIDGARRSMTHLIELTEHANETQVHTVAELPESAEAERAYCAKVGVASFLVVPLIQKGERRGGIVFCRSEADAWDETTVHELEIVGRLLIQGLQRMRAEVQLRQSQTNLARAEELGLVGTWSVDIPSQRLAVSDHLRSMLGIRESTATFVEYAGRVHPESQADFATWITDMRARRDGGESVPIRILSDDDEPKFVACTGFIDRNEQGEVTRVFGVTLDVTRHVLTQRALATALADVRTLKERAEQETAYLREAARKIGGYGALVGDSPAFQHCLELVESVAGTHSTVLVLGETGTGKELIARAIHESSARRDKPLISVNCAALAESLIETELFGHEKGAFTGAHSRRIGRFELADGGTLFLDEIGDLAAGLQVKLLRVLQEGVIERVGSSTPIRVDVRVIAATHRDLSERMITGAFRSDLYYRLNGFPIQVPPLRERKSDIPRLVEHLVAKHSERMGHGSVVVSPEILRIFDAYDWPGNVRELESVIERAIIIGRGRELVLSGIEFISAPVPRGERVRRTRGSSPRTLAQAERDHILDVLDETGWVIEGPTGSAATLGLKPSTLRSRIRKHGIERPS